MNHGEKQVLDFQQMTNVPSSSVGGFSRTICASVFRETQRACVPVCAGDAVSPGVKAVILTSPVEAGLSK